MGANIVYKTASPGSWDLEHFNNVIVAKLVLPRGNWVVMGRLIMTNDDNDWQPGSASINQQANVVVDLVTFGNMMPPVRHMVYLQAVVYIAEEDVITLNCNTYKGQAECASLMAFDVDNVADI
jgi:hypothetical protein